MTRKRAHVLLCACVLWASPAPGQLPVPELGEPPRLELTHLAPEIQRLRDGAPQNTGWINVFNREAVRVSYNDLVATANNVPMEWTGSVSAGNPGTTSAAYKNAVLAYLNF